MGTGQLGVDVTWVQPRQRRHLAAAVRAGARTVPHGVGAGGQGEGDRRAPQVCERPIEGRGVHRVLGALHRRAGRDGESARGSIVV